MTLSIDTSVERRRNGVVSLGPFGRIAAMARRIAQEGIHWPSAKYQKDPVGFAKEALGVQPWDKQIELLEAIRDHERVAVRSGHKVSKSHSLAIAALWFFSSFDDARVVCTCVTARQVDEIFYRECKKLHSKAKMRLDGDPRETARAGIKSDDYREIVGFTAKEAEAVAGISGANLLYLVDEASGVPDAILEAIEGNRAGGARIVATSNPTRTEGWFFEAFSAKSEWKQIHISSLDSPNVKAGRDVIPGLARLAWVEQKKREWGEESAHYQVRVLGNFVAKEEGKIISLHLLQEAEERWESTPANGRLFVGVDPAGPGQDGDETAFAARRGLKQTALVAHRGLDAPALTVHLLGFLSTERREREVPVVVLDAEGQIGARVNGNLRAHLDQHPGDFELYAVRSSQPAYREPQIYGSTRDELWANAAKFLREGGALLEDDKQSQDLHAPSWEAMATFGTNSSRLRATDKKKLKQKLKRSPDRGDAFCLSVWEPRQLLEETVNGAVAARSSEDLDPYEDDTARALSPYGGSF